MAENHIFSIWKIAKNATSAIKDGAERTNSTTSTWVYTVVMACIGTTFLFLAFSDLVNPEEKREVEYIQFVGSKYGSENNSPYTLLMSYLSTRFASRLEENSKDGQRHYLKNIRLGELLDSTGSLNTLAEIDKEDPKSNKHLVGIVQSDVLYHYVNGKHPQLAEGRSVSNLRAIAKVMPEWIHLYGNPRHVEKSASQNWIKSNVEVCAGDLTFTDVTLGSGHLFTAINVLRSTGLPYMLKENCQDKQHEVRISVHSTPARNANHEYILGMPRKMQNILYQSYPRLYTPIESDVFLADCNSQRTKCLASQGDSSMSVHGVLVASKGMSIEVVNELLSILELLDSRVCHCDRSSKDVSSSQCATLSDIEKDLKKTLFCDLKKTEKDNYAHENRITKLPISQHGAVTILQLEDFLSRQLAEMQLATVRGFVYFAIGILLLAPILLTIVTSVKAAGASAHRNYTSTGNIIVFQQKVNIQLRKWALPAIIFLVFHLIIAILIWLSELNSEALQKDPTFVSKGIPNAIKVVLSYVMADKDIEFHSMMSLFWIGSLKAGWSIVAFSLLVQMGQKFVNLIKGSPYVDHAIIIGWNERTIKLVRDLKAQNKAYRIFAFSGEQQLPTSIDNVEYIGDHIDLFKHDRLAKCATIIVTADRERAKDRGERDVDLWVYRVVSALTTHFDVIEDREVYIVAEVVRENNRELVRRAGADEVICIEAFGAELLAHTATKRCISDVFERLVSTSDHTNEVYYREVDHENVTSFRMAHANSVSSHAERLEIPIGIIKADNRVLLNPAIGEDSFDPGDKLIVIAWES